MSGKDFRDFKVTIVGAGRLGSTLARRLYDLGNPAFSVISRDAAWLETLAITSHPVSFSTRIDNLHRETTFLVLAVPDDHLKETVSSLSQILFFDWQNTMVVHVSGALDASVLAPLKKLGAVTGACHPIQTFPTRDEPGDRFDHIYWGIDAPAAHQRRLKDFVNGLGGSPVVIPASARPMYHLACVMVSNYLVTLSALSGDVLAACGVNREDGRKMMLPLIEGTLRGLEIRSPVQSLTGPIARGDEATIRQHIDELGNQLPHLVPVYAELALETLRLAVRKETLSPAQVQELNHLLTDALNRHRSDRE